MKLGVVTLFPDMFTAISGYGISGRAFDNNLLSLECWNPRSFTTDVHQTVDSRPYGGGPGMVMMAEPLRDALHAARAALPKAKVIYLSPQGRTLDQRAVESFAAREELILLCGRYEGVDERLLALEVDEECSIGDYILSGGELPAMVLIDAMIRILPNALGHAESAKQDSFSSGLLDFPQYARPEVYDGVPVPRVLLSGHHEQIRRWRLQQALHRTRERRPELLERKPLNKEENTLLNTPINND
ncbi:MAG: tRNA (guanosine(37)-N1)-methyltransferase TrmD [Cellvibrionales bacterium]|nr:tRNA (guanosine(37)-N1)-methyltransferase TrmD [Cellvibrionales bacterium]MBK8675222.1 tRNA (guanosine(37)-N1)-methyltransferase TrmD [Cellvibrionales bacterium]TXH50853.1 MAG: tRNA (guanosine(37)-N1)-methyltransferase TrmD [Cellvibrionales bacterium]